MGQYCLAGCHLSSSSSSVMLPVGGQLLLQMELRGLCIYLSVGHISEPYN